MGEAIAFYTLAAFILGFAVLVVSTKDTVHSVLFLVLDFLFVQPQRGPNGEAVASLRARIITTPEHTKRVLRALEDNVQRYEAAFGTIQEATDLPSVLQ